MPLRGNLQGVKMNKISSFRLQDIAFTKFGEAANKAAISKLVDSKHSETIGAGLATFDGLPVKWTVKYDEVIAVIRGEFTLTTGGKSVIMSAGDVIWIPADTDVEYAGKDALVFYALYPVNWQEIAAKSQQH